MQQSCLKVGASSAMALWVSSNSHGEGSDTRRVGRYVVRSDAIGVL